MTLDRDFTFRAVFLDALGTMVELEPPWVHLRNVVPDRITDERLVAAVKAEMAYYKEHAHEGRDEASLADLRGRCAAIISEGLEVEVTVDELVEAVKLNPFPDSAPALTDLREKGLRLFAVSNWDCSLNRVLERCGLRELLDGVVTSAETGFRKPDPGIFEVALSEAGCRAEEALHVGDTPEEDIAGAEAAGIRALLIDRDGTGDIASLAEIEDHLGPR